MMTETILALLIAVRAVESHDGTDPRANGNDLQITKVCVDDVNRIYHTRYKWPEDTRIREHAENIYFLYLTYWGTKRFEKTGRIPTIKELAAIWNAGPRGADKPIAKPYVRKIERELRRQRHTPHTPSPKR